MAFIEEIAVRIGLDPKEFRAGVRSVLKDLKSVKDAFKDMGGGVEQIGDGLKQFTKTLTVVTGGLVAATGAVYKLTEASAAQADQAKATAAALGLTIEQYGRLSYAAQQSSVSQEEFGAGFTRFNKLVVEAQRGNKEAIETFRRLGVRIKSSNGAYRDLNVTLFDNKGRALQSAQVLEQVAEAFSMVQDGTAKTARAVQVFGRSGARMIPFLNEGSRGIRKLGDEAEELGIVFTKEQGIIGDEFGDAIDRAKFSLTGLRNQIGLAFAPDATKLADAFTEKVKANRKEIQAAAIEGWQFAKQTVLDFYNAFQGQDAQVSQEWVLKLTKNIQDFAAAVRDIYTNVLVPFATAANELFGKIANGINEAFGTKLTVADIAVAAFAARTLGFFTLLAGALNVVIPLVRVLGTLINLVLLKPLLALATSTAIRTGLAYIGSAIAAAVTALVALIGLPATIAIGVVAAVTAIVVFFDDIKAAALSTYNFIVGLYTKMADAIRKGIQVGRDFIDGFTGAKESGTVDLSRPPIRRARGGRVPGQGKGDKVPALLEPNEFVMRGAAVRKFGVGLFEQLNRGILPGFADGGLASSGGQPVNLHLDGATYPLRASQDVVADLTRAARAVGRRKPGVGPSWQR